MVSPRDLWDRLVGRSEGQGVSVLPAFVRESFLSKFLLALVVIVLLGAAVGAVFYGGISHTLDRQVDRQVRATTALHAKVYGEWFANRRERLRSIVAESYITSSSSEQISEELRFEATRSDAVRDYHLVELETGEVIASSSEGAVGANFYGFGPDRGVVTDRQRFVSPGRYETTDGETVVALWTHSSYVDRVLVAEVDPETAGPTLPQPVRGSTTYVVGSDREVVFGPENVTGLPAESGTFPADEVLLSRGGQWMTSYTRLPRTKLLVVTRTPVSEAFAVKQEVLLSFWTTILLVLAILVVVSVFVGRAAINDLEDLVEKARRMGKGDLDVTLSTRRTDEIGVLYESFAAMRDALRTRITEAEDAQRRAQAAMETLERRNRRIEEQRSIISVLNRVLRHNVRNDISVIDGHLVLLREHVDEEGRAHLEKIEATTDDLTDKADKARHIENLVRRDPGSLSPVDLTALVGETVEQFRREYDDAQITTDLPLDVTVRAHEALGFVFTNLIENAIEHNDKAVPEVEVSATVEPSGEVAVDVVDNGPGIPANEVEILDEGYESAVKHGSGLGLWLVNWLVDEMDGTLTFQRREPTGTVVTVTLQLSRDGSLDDASTFAESGPFDETGPGTQSESGSGAESETEVEP